MQWRLFSSAPRDGFGFLAYGHHDDPVPTDAGRGVRPGDHWWAILQFDIWREPHQFVFARDGAPAWPGAIAWTPLEPPTSITVLSKTFVVPDR
ncbi:hypothetical protein [Roseisolibacter sp. H3M3-2]|uniref:hypothetical protein n=1 Tax=Roseisolibacter sp. H3M3-2 TaxID=3031323 RepID=UPI0023DC65DB|nr:hypothetical protein [Roseisolibacter sp. H3M3-2]MDF1506212.1 hypothetical protein [Roseisolibacter sp. H3M3-2]